MQDACLRSTSPETSPTRTRARSARGTKPTRTIRMHTTRHTGKSPRPSLARRQRPPRSPPTTPSRTNTTTRQLTSTPPARRARTPQAPRLTARRTRPRQISPPQTSLTRQTTPHTTTATPSPPRTRPTRTSPTRTTTASPTRTTTAPARATTIRRSRPRKSTSPNRKDLRTTITASSLKNNARMPNQKTGTATPLLSKGCANQYPHAPSLRNLTALSQTRLAWLRSSLMVVPLPRIQNRSWTVTPTQIGDIPTTIIQMPDMPLGENIQKSKTVQ